MDQDYSAYLPHVNVKDGKARVINNLKLYKTLLGKFNGRELANDVIAAINAKDSTNVVHSAHALKGTSANLGFPEVCKITDEIENLGKGGNDASHLIEPLNASVNALMETIEKFLDAK